VRAPRFEASNQSGTENFQHYGGPKRAGKIFCNARKDVLHAGKQGRDSSMQVAGDFLRAIKISGLGHCSCFDFLHYLLKISLGSCCSVNFHQVHMWDKKVQLQFHV
jgi:hypothetical protein